MSDKPLKTVEEILEDLIYDTPNSYGYPPDFEPDFKQAKANLYQLMLSLVGEDEHSVLISKNDLNNTEVINIVNQRVASRNKLRAELRAKLSEHFNVEGV